MPSRSKMRPLGIGVTIGCETREISATEFMSICERKGVRIMRDWHRLSCADKRGRAILAASPELEAAVLIEMASGDTEVRDTLKERIAILWVEGLPH